MKVIDLLNKIANGEEVPKKIKYKGWSFTFDRQPQDYYSEVYGNLFEYLINEMRISEFINNEVEIIEPQEHKIPEKITMRAGLVGDINNKLENLDINQIAIEDKINEILDYLEEIE